MTDIVLPVSLDVASIRLRKLEYVGVSRNPYNGTVRRALRGGDKFGGSIELTPQGGASTTSRVKRRRMIATLMQAGKYNPLLVYDPSYTPAGSFSAPELLTNTQFSGTTGWAGGIGNEVLSATDGVLRVTKNATGAGSQAAQSSVACTQYAPYAARFVVSTPQSWAFSAYLDVSGTAVSGGMAVSTNVPLASTFSTISVFQGNAGMAGDYFDISYASAARCIYTDNGPNALQRSDELGNAFYTATAASVTSNSITAPDGTATAENLVPNTSNTAHYLSSTAGITVAAAAADYVLTVACKAGYNFLGLQLSEATGATVSYVLFNLSTGAVGVTAATGVNWSNRRAFISSLGGGWYQCTLIVRKTNAATSITPYIIVTNADSVATFAGDGTTGIGIWRATLAQSSVPVRLSQTVATAAASGTAQTGASLYVKGLPASTNGLLEIGDAVEIYTSLGSQYGVLISRLNSDASGLGILQVWPAIRGSVADNAVIIVNKPMLRVIMPDGVPEYLTEPGLITTGSAIDFEETPS